MNETKKLYRLDHGALAGVCGGVAEYFNVDANLVRLIWVALCFAGTAGLWLYAAALLLPRRARSTPRLVRTTENTVRRPPSGGHRLLLSVFGGGIDMNFYERVYQSWSGASRRGSAPPTGSSP